MILDELCSSQIFKLGIVFSQMSQTYTANTIRLDLVTFIKHR